MNNDDTPRQGILSSVRILDIAHQYSGAHAAAILADLGAEVVAIEHPEGSPIRSMHPKKDGESLWWKVAQRGKKNITLNLSTKRGREIFLKLVKDFDVLVENFRPGTLERWGIGPADLEAAGANLALLRISGFGQTGPSSAKPGFGTVAEAMSGFAHMNGFPDGPPTFPSTTLADGVASLWGAFGIVAALLHKRHSGAKGVEVIDVALVEGLFRLIPTQIPAYHLLGKVLTRPGNFPVDHGVLRNVYFGNDGKCVVIASVGPIPIRRILVAAGATALIDEIDSGIMSTSDSDKLETFLKACDSHLTHWAGQRPLAEVTAALDAADAIYAPIYSSADIVNDAQFKARDDLVMVPDAGGPIMMQGIVPKFPSQNHSIRHAGKASGNDNEDVFGALGLTASELRVLKEDGVI